jgi:PEP-CTERM motif
MKKYLFALTLSVLSGMLLANAASAVTYTEGSDAGQTPGTASGTPPGGLPLTAIFGSISGVNDADVFLINIVNPAAFLASTVNMGTGLDTALFLFDVNGHAVYTNDDANGMSLQSTLPSGNAFGPLTAGLYYIGISLSGNEPVDFANQLVFAMGLSTDVRGPANNVNGSWVNFDNNASFAENGSYEIDLAGVQSAAIPEPSTWVLLLTGLGCAAVISVRRRLA